MREGQRNLADQQERAAAAAALAVNAELAEKRERRDSRDSPSSHHNRDADRDRDRDLHHHKERSLVGSGLFPGQGAPGSGSKDYPPRSSLSGSSPILNLTKLPGGGGHESPISEHGSGEPRVEDIASEDEEDAGGKKRKDVVDVAKVDNNNKELNGNNKPGSGMTQPSPLSIPGFPNLMEGMAAAAAAGQRGGNGNGGGDANQMNSVYGLVSNIQALLKMAVENNKTDDKKGKRTKIRREIEQSLTVVSIFCRRQD